MFVRRPIMTKPVSKYNTQATLTTDQWKAVLNFTTKWQFDDVRQTAISQLDQAKIEPVEKILLALRCHVGEWLVPAISRICQREAPISLVDAQRLMEVVDLEWVLKVTHIREASDSPPASTGSTGSACICKTHNQYCVVACTTPAPEQRASKDFTKLIKTTFDLE
jgi:hypothetical protein